MSSGSKIHVKSTATNSKRAILNARPRRRAAFAIGAFGGFHVMLARRGRPNGALTELKKLGPPEEAPPNAQKATFRPLNSGLLYREGTALVIQSRRRLALGQIQGARQYFKVMKVGVPWSKIRLRRLGDEDEGDGDDAGVEEEFDTIAADSAESEAGDDDDILDEWETDSGAARQEELAEDTDAAEPSAPAQEPARAEAVEQVIGLLEGLAPRLKLETELPAAELRRTVEKLLETMTRDRLLLALCYTPNVEQLAAAARDGTPEVPNDPIENDEVGHGEIGQALAAAGARIARERGILAPGDQVDGDAHLKAMVRQRWEAKPQLEPDEIVRELVNLFGAMFEAWDGKRVRATLGVTSWSDTLEKLRTSWENDRSGADSAVAQIKAVISASYEETGDAISLLDQFVARLNVGLGDSIATLVSLPGTTPPSAAVSSVLAQVRDLQAFLGEDEVALNLDGNDLVPSTSIVAPLRSRLDDLQTSLGRIAAG